MRKEPCARREFRHAASSEVASMQFVVGESVMLPMMVQQL